MVYSHIYIHCTTRDILLTLKHLGFIITMVRTDLVFI